MKRFYSLLQELVIICIFTFLAYMLVDNARPYFFFASVLVLIRLAALIILR